MKRQVKTRLLDSRLSYNNVVDHRNLTTSPLCLYCTADVMCDNIDCVYVQFATAVLGERDTKSSVYL